MSNIFDFVQRVIEFVEKKAKSFLEKKGLGHLYDGIRQSAKENNTSVTDYINKILNDTINVVADNKKEDRNKLREEFNSHYLS